MRGNLGLSGRVGRACIAAVVVALALPSLAAAATFKVRSAGDAADANPDGICASVGGDPDTCTLKAAIQEAVGTAGPHTIQFAGSMVGQTIDTSGLPSVSQNGITIDGCSSDPGHKGPCVGLRLQTFSSIAVLDVNASDIELRGLALTNGGAGVGAAPGADGLRVRNNWIGLKLDQTPEANTAGVLLRGDDSVVGGSSGADRNVISRNGTGVRILGGDDNRVRGNYIGVRPNGSTSAGNGEGVEVVDEAISDDPAFDNLIGGTVSSSKASTTRCDGVCNVISASNAGEGGYGIDLRGEGPDDEAPAEGTTVAGNFIGLDRDGNLDRGNDDDGVHATASEGTMIGGESSRDRNVIAGNAAVASDDLKAQVDTFGAPDVQVLRNYVGLTSSGRSALEQAGVLVILINGTVSRNRLGDRAGGGDPIGIGVGHAGAKTVTRNKIGITTTGAPAPTLYGIGIDSDGAQIGGDRDTEGNTIGYSTSNGITIFNAGSNNTIEGNYIGTNASGDDLGNGGAGVSMFGAIETLETTGNTIGGDSGNLANVISNNGGDAVTIMGDGADGNRLLRNTGKGNGAGPNDLFIDLVGANGFGNGASGPNMGIGVPTIGAASASSASGTALAGASVRLYRTKSAAGTPVRRIEGFLGVALADGSGDWSLAFPALPSGQRITATQTTSGGTSELTLAVAP